MLWVRISIRARCTTLCDKVCQWLQGLKIALARSPGPPCLTAGLPRFVTRKTQRTGAYKIYPPINFTYIDEMMTFLHKSKFPMINIVIIITITYQNCFLLWSAFYFWNNSLCRQRDIGIDQLCYTHSGFRYFDLLQPQGSCCRAIRVKKSPCGACLHFLVCQKRSPSRLIILKSSPRFI
jgi:hypothetical protein